MPNRNSKSKIIFRIFNSDNYINNVDKDLFLDAMSDLCKVVFFDDRLKSTHDIVTFIIPPANMNFVRSIGINTNLIGYNYDDEYHLHYIPYNTTKKINTIFAEYNLECVRKKVRLEKFKPILPEFIC